MVDGTAQWLGARGFVVRDVIEDGNELVVAIETTIDAPGGVRCVWDSGAGEGSPSSAVAGRADREPAGAARVA